MEFLRSELHQDAKSGTELGNNCYKIRIPNSSIPTGKSGGFRIITYYTIESDVIRLLLIYSKRDRENITDKEIQEILQKK